MRHSKPFVGGTVQNKIILLMACHHLSCYYIHTYHTPWHAVRRGKTTISDPFALLLETMDISESPKAQIAKEWIVTVGCR